ncbi:glycosyltransferase family 2 protein [Spirillospora albida]|uniref:glycosyltransferase family 2 protein n=1 Tax=Spirillospora albida TaxID=58123 RepID=UPI00069000B8|nr:glycosyltransferase family 2 protein [Spirillospora albida]
MATPKVSVIVPVHNSKDTLRRTFESVFAQTLPPEQVEIIAVDDGSTDGAGEELDRLAEGRPGFRVVHQDASGGPGRPRNVGLDLASGEYVFFLDADDHLAPEALERCCAMADENGTDVVVPKYVGVGRGVNRKLFERTVPFTTIFDAVPNLYGSITVLKLYRRSLLERHGIRFPEGVLSGEDQIFAVRAYFEAKGVSVLADYDCYYWVAREDGTSALQQGGAPAAAYFPKIKELMAFVAERTAPGPVRDRLLRRHFMIEVFSRFDPRYKDFSEEERRLTREAARELLDEYGNPEILAVLSPYSRLIDYALRHGMDDLADRAALAHAEGPPEIVVDGDDAYAAYPGFREGTVPDEVFLVRGPLDMRHGVTGVEWRDGLLVVHGYAFVNRLAGDRQQGELVLRRREGGEEVRVPFESGGEKTLTARIDFTGRALPPGRYDAYAVVTVDGRAHEGRLVPDRNAGPLPGGRVAPVAEGLPVITPYLTKGSRALALHVGGLGGRHGPASPAKIALARPGLLRIDAEIGAVPVAATARVLLRRRGSDDVRAAELEVGAEPGRLVLGGEIPVSGLRRGKWDVLYEITVNGATGAFRAAVGEAPEEGFGRRGPRPFRTVAGNLSFEIGSGSVRLVRRFMGRGA